MTDALTEIVGSVVRGLVDFVAQVFPRRRQPVPGNIRKGFLESRGIDPKELSPAEQAAKLAMVPKEEWESIKLAPFAVANGITVYDMVRVHRSMAGVPWEPMK